MSYFSEIKKQVKAGKTFQSEVTGWFSSPVSREMAIYSFDAEGNMQRKSYETLTGFVKGIITKLNKG